MKNLILILILLLSNLFVQSIFAFDRNDAECCNNCSKEDFNRSLIYKFGMPKIHSVIITENDERYDVSVTNSVTNYDGNIITSECKESSILKWAFEEMPEELETIQHLKIDYYDPLYYNLTLSTQEGEIPVASSTMQITGNKKLIKKIGELRAFLIKFWTSTFADYQNP